MNLTPAQIVRTSRVIVYKRLRFFMVPLFKLREVEDPSCPSLSVDQGLRLFYNAGRVLKWGVEFTPTFLAHEVQHVLRGHFKRMEAWMARNAGRCLRVQRAIEMLWPGAKGGTDLFNIAEDAEINDEMEATGFAWPPDFTPVLPSNLLPPEGLAAIGYLGPLQDGKTAEFYADLMLRACEKLTDQNSQPGDGGQQGPGSGDCDQEGDEDAPAEDGDGQGGDDEDREDEEGGDQGEPRDDEDRSSGDDRPGDQQDSRPGNSGREERDPGDPQDRPADGDGGSGGAGMEAEGGGQPAGRGPGQGCCGGCSGNRGEHENFDDPNLPEPASENDLDLIRRRVALDLLDEMKKSSDGRGTGIGGFWMEWSKAILRPPKIDWRQVLAKRVRGAVTAARARVDWKYGPPSRRREVMRHIMGDEAPLLPVLRGPSPQVVFVVDVSGSMLGARIKRAFSEVLGISKACSHVPCAGVAVDMGVQGVVQKVRTAEDLMRLNKGGGGTDMRIGIKVASELKPAPEVIIVVTDGETPWPHRKEMPKKAEVVVCVVNRNRSYYDDLPPHLKRSAVLVGEDDREGD